MKNLLDLIPSNNIAETEKDLISTEVKEIIGSYKRSSSALNQLAFESITALAANDARLKELSQSESFFTKILPIAKNKIYTLENKSIHIRNKFSMQLYK